MTFSSDKTGAAAVWSDIQSIIDALTGVSGGGDRVQLIQYNNSSNYALDVRNLDTGSSLGLRVRDAADAVIATFAKDAIVLGADPASDALTINCNIAGKVYIGDSANGSMTVGLTINQSAATDEILCFKSSSVNQVSTNLSEADSFASFRRTSNSGGGLLIRGFSDADLASTAATVEIRGLHGVAADTTKSTSGVGVVQVVAELAGTPTTGSVDTDGNLFAIRNKSTTRFIFDGDGDSHQDVGTAWTNFDDHDDVALLHALSAGVARQDDPVRREFAAYLDEHREALKAARIVTFNEDGHHFINWSRANMLVIGAIRQLGQRLELAEQKLLALPA